MTDQPVRAIVGPTGAGKSAMAMEVAHAGASVEIVAIDAFTVYRGMDIGTAKPSAADRATVAHHMIDVLDPDQAVDVQWFQAEARAAIADTQARSHEVLLVGGSGLYFRAVVDDLRFPPTEPDVRAAIHDRWADDPPAGHRHLATIDPAAAAKIEPDNVRRTVRALEVIELTGQPFSSFADAWDNRQAIYPDLEVTYLEPPTPDLRQAIAQRSRGMVDEGLLDEAADLRRRFSDGLSHTAEQAIGYAEAFAVLDGHCSVDDLPDAIATRTWAYARRQRAWFRADPRCMAPSGRADGTIQQPHTL